MNVFNQVILQLYDIRYIGNILENNSRSINLKALPCNVKTNSLGFVANRVHKKG